ncbi:rhomboid family serine protease [Halalkalibacter wakoensis JCM 9140]|uniref:Rhomboid family serine protease n=1 Tax=Halalkalibacter wakoensis JCM 9140 TaxID=1236970 RepID=W4PYK3_9BACI|nr:rhomboid family intramembrane serine protease [Halalkalibacter wakoensis]GAE24770.1 rhomboid family serine protease [Halalkalibacter wakoensis JCM 9140]
MERQQDYVFWKAVHHYIFEKGCRVIEQSRNEVWLEEEDTHPKRIIRFVRVDIDFSIWLRRDITESVKQFERIRRHFRFRRLIGENIYISEYPPVDEWEDIKKPFFESKRKRTTVTSKIIDRANQSALSLPSVPLQGQIQDLDLNLTIEHLKQQINHVTREREQKEKSLFFYGKPLTTLGLLAVLSYMFYQLEQAGGSTSVLTLIEYGAKYNPLIMEGEWWRLITAMFLHIGFLHLFMNSLALFYLGGAVERMYGTTRFLFIYFVAGLFGSIASFAFNEQVAAGASGAIFGCFGALLYFGTVYKKLFFRTMGKSLLTILAINLVFGFSIPMVDNGAHIGGLVGGFLAAMVVQLPKHRKVPKQLLSLVVTIFLMGGLYLFGLNNEQKTRSPLLELQIGQEYLQQDNLEAAYPFLQRAVEEGADMPEAYFLLAYAEAMFENYEFAKELLIKTIEERPSFHEAHYNLSLVYIELEQIEEARSSLKRAIELHPDEAYLDLYERVKEEN